MTGFVPALPRQQRRIDEGQRQIGEGTGQQGKDRRRDDARQPRYEEHDGDDNAADDHALPGPGRRCAQGIEQAAAGRRTEEFRQLAADDGQANAA